MSSGGAPPGTPPLTREIAALVEHYLGEWDSRGWASAYHSLVELGPQILPEVERRFFASRDSAFRAALVEMARRMSSVDALSLFDAALRDASPEVWKNGLDGLVALATPGAIAVLEAAAPRSPPGRTSREEWEGWVLEAIEQARAEWVARGGAA